MKKIIAGVVCAMAVLSLVGCSTTYEENYPARSSQAYSNNDQPVQGAQYNNVCYVRDRDGRKWQAQGNRACHHALHKCRQWHNERNMENYRCWVDN